MSFRTNVVCCEFGREREYVAIDEVVRHVHRSVRLAEALRRRNADASMRREVVEGLGHVGDPALTL